METNKYYTPELEDLRVGYECEIYKQSTTKLIKNVVWHSVKVQIGSEIGLHVSIGECKKLIKNGHIRTSYLTKEQIENEGWKFTASHDTGTQCFSKGDLYIVYSEDNHRIFIKKDVDEPVIYTIPFFSGECKSINEFRTITKLLNII